MQVALLLLVIAFLWAYVVHQDDIAHDERRAIRDRVTVIEQRQYQRLEWFHKLDKRIDKLEPTNEKE